ncbi:MAG: TlpA family protein disulfide reductase [Chitinophagaceae bacterium]|nr:TlpA family protein disulfide reductase [Chitinophagaceae bacterium]
MRLNKIIAAIGLSLLLYNVQAQETANISDPRLQIRLPAVNGDSISLASLKGKVVLLDFWASWCMPCRAANKHLAKLYTKYKPKGFEIFSVSVDEEKSAWKKAITKDKITWLQVNDAAGNMGKTILDWNVSVLPTTFLINKKGDVVAIDLEGKALDEAVARLLQE